MFVQATQFIRPIVLSLLIAVILVAALSVAAVADDHDISGYPAMGASQSADPVAGATYVKAPDGRFVKQSPNLPEEPAMYPPKLDLGSEQ